MSTMDNWNAPRWADFNASLMSDIDDYFNTEHSELERRHTSGTDSLSATISEQPQESSAPDDYTEEEGASNNATLVETNDEVVPSVEADEHKVDSPKPVEEKKPENKIVKVNQSRRPRVLTSSIRRQSISRYRRRSDQYVPLAEALKKFQNGTPTRFRSNKSKDNNGAPLQKVKQTRMKLTCPMSPALRCKSRTRTVSTVSQKSEPALKPVAKSSSFPRAFPSTLHKTSSNTKPLRKIEKIPVAATSQTKKAMLPPKIPATVKEADKTLSVPNSSKDTSLLSNSILSKSMRKHNTPAKKMAPTVVSTDEGMKIKEVEVLHFGIPVGNVNKKITRPKPFSFETRTKELQNKKVKLKTQQEEAEKMKKPAFHAKAAPSSNVMKKTTAVLKPKENNVNKANPTTRMLTFKERNELALKKKKELMDQIVENEKKARVFHAKPAPTFKPVFVRGNSTENLRAGEKNKGKTRGISPAARQRGQSQESLVSGNQENEAPTVANHGCPKLKNPLITEKQKLKRTTK